MQKSQRIRTQKGHVFEKSGHFYIRYYTTVKGVRKQKAELLCEKDEKHHSKTCKPVKILRDKVMLRVNSEADCGEATPTVSDFWESTYLPFAEQNLRPSTVYSYKDIWERHLQSQFNGARLSEYKPASATAFLTSLTKKLGRNLLNHVRSLMSEIFSHAPALGHIVSLPTEKSPVSAGLNFPTFDGISCC
jgi:hypothetical protein